ncbi:MAG TPA: nickel pincer cofactor biosynthesis protein LarC [Candidatus Limnocylindria bacterium]|nr:nickel pincer cofactor biosynthesis protein LarC [Candidatus Limnocylindria bacterium]
MTDRPPEAAPRIGWVDASNGASGDMLLAALVGSGVPLAVIQDAVASLGVPVRVEVLPATDTPLTAWQALVTPDEVEPPRRTLGDVRAILEAAGLDASVRDLALAVFERLAQAEALVHGTRVEDVHFHEVGALDALADVVGCAAGFVHLALDAVVVSPLALGSGVARSAHGEIPVPVPAVLELLRASGLSAFGGDVPFEQCTPTGAAILSTVATTGGPMPAMTVSAIGVGTGTRRLVGRSNALRLVLGTPEDGARSESRALVLTTNVDDLDPRLWPGVLEQLLEAGAQDAWLTPILMKKGRPAHTLSVLCGIDQAAALRTVVFRETSAIGLREQTVDKHALARSEVVVEVTGGPVRIKLAHLDGIVVNAQPEYDDVVAAARASGRPAKTVLADATAAARALDPSA